MAADGIWSAHVAGQRPVGRAPGRGSVRSLHWPAQTNFQIPSLEVLEKAAGQQLANIQQKMGGSYGYCLGYLAGGILQPTRNSNRDYFAILADAPPLTPH